MYGGIGFLYQSGDGHHLLRGDEYRSCPADASQVPEKRQTDSAGAGRLFLEAAFFQRKGHLPQPFPVQIPCADDSNRSCGLYCTDADRVRAAVRDWFDIRTAVREIFTYDSTLSLSDNQSAEQIETLTDTVTGTDGISGVLPLTSKQTDAVSLDGKNTVVSITMYVPAQPEQLGGFITLRDRETGEPLSLTDEGCVITEKLSRLLSVEVGDSFYLRDSNGERQEIKVTGITETYVSHYIYMTPTLYESLYREQPLPTALLLTWRTGQMKTAPLQASSSWTECRV